MLHKGAKFAGHTDPSLGRFNKHFNNVINDDEKSHSFFLENENVIPKLLGSPYSDAVGKCPCCTRGKKVYMETIQLPPYCPDRR